MNLNSKKKSTRVCVGLFFLLGGTEYGERVFLDTSANKENLYVNALHHDRKAE